MQYQVLVEQKDGLWRAIIPELHDIVVEGNSYREAVANAQRAAEEYLSRVIVTTIYVDDSRAGLRPGSPKSVLKLAAAHRIDPDDDLDREYLAEMETQKQREREEAERQAEREDSCEVARQ
jgi:predicted RNase H-like HicB family nuclease